LGEGEFALGVGGGVKGQCGVGGLECDCGVGDGAVLGVVNYSVEGGEDGGEGGDGGEGEEGGGDGESARWGAKVRGGAGWERGASWRLKQGDVPFAEVGGTCSNRR
jgi:hypothetical protein